LGVKINILKNASAGIFSKFSGSLIRLLQVPLLLHFLGVEDFGRWTVLYTIPAWLSFTNFGFGSVGANQISMNVAKGDYINARRVFSTILAIIGSIAIIGFVLSIFIVPLIKWEILLKTSALRHNEYYSCVLWLCLSVFISFLYEPFWGIFRAAHKAHIGVLLTSLLPWFNLLAIFISLKTSIHFDLIAMALFLSNILFLFIYFLISSKVMPELSFSFKTIQPSQIMYLFRKGVAFQAFPLGNALVIQGYIIIIQTILGPAAVSLFSTAKTLVNTVKQGLDVICQATWPELSHLIGSNDLQKAKTIHYTGVALAIVLSISGVILLTVFGVPIYHLWVGKSILLPFPLLLLFLAPLPFNALWVTSSVIHLSSNRHEGLALRYLFAAFISSVACFVLTYIIGIAGAAISILIMDIILIPYVIRHSLILTNDTWNNFYHGTVKLLKESPHLFLKTVLNLLKNSRYEKVSDIV
jgi:O-antigen/teichoic acid export membrane protein